MQPGYRQYQPCPALASVIECYWVLNSPEGSFRHEERLIPGGRVELIFNFSNPVHWLFDPQAQLAGDRKRPGSDNPIGNVNPFGDREDLRAQIMGQRDRIFYVRATGSTSLLGVRFSAGGLSAFTNLPVDRLLNKMTPAGSVFGRRAEQWIDELANTRTESQKIKTLDTLMHQSLRPLPDSWLPLRSILHDIRHQPSPPSIDHICRQTGWNYRRLERTFLRSTGYSPKHYTRIVRFNHAIRLIKSSQDQSLTSIAYECGYFDQAHFIKDFRRFAGITPGRFATEKNAIADLLIRWQPV